MDHKRGSFSGKIGFVLSAAGASVGLGNIWRFPYLAAKYGGAIFLLVYIILAMTFGYTMIIAETSIGRMTGKSPVGAYKSFSDKPALRVGGWINAIIPILIVPYYSVIGGWVIKYLAEYLMGKAHLVAEDGYFSSFISNGVSSELCFLVFTAMTLAIIFAGVENGIERVSKIMMPILVVLSLIIAVYSVTRPGALEGVKYFLVPNLDNFSWMTVVSAMGQMFYSLSIAMGILITFGSYMKKDVPIESSTRNVEVFDTAIAIMAGLMIIPAVFAFSGGDPSALKAGPSLMFITIPKVFDSMGFGTVIGIAFFLLVLFAALTSSIALTESAVSTLQDELHWSRREGHEHHGRLYGSPRKPLQPGLRPAGKCHRDRHAVFGLLRFPDQLRDDAHRGHRKLHPRLPRHRRRPHRGRGHAERRALPQKEGLQRHDPLPVPVLRGDHFDQLDRQRVRLDLDVNSRAHRARHESKGAILFCERE